MKFEVLYANGVQNEVELPGHTVVVGRDPGCDLVLNDTKCSRRHAVIEMGPSGLAVRDNGSANGVFVNGRKLERSPLVPGDILRLGETVLTVLAESTGTFVMDEADVGAYPQTEDLTRPQDLEELPGLTPARPVQPLRPPVKAPPAPPPAPRAASPATPPPIRPQAAPPPPSSPAPPPRSAPPQPPAEAASSRPPKPAPAGPIPRGALPRPLTVTALAVLWLLAGAAYGAIGLGVSIFGPGGSAGIAAGVAGVLLAGLSGVVGLGLWARAPWARLLQLVLAGMGVFSCIFTLPSIVIIAYLLRPEIQLHFAGPRILAGDDLEKSQAKTPELAFAVGIAATLAFSVLLSAATAYAGRSLLGRARVPPVETQAPPAAAPGRN